MADCRATMMLKAVTVMSSKAPTNGSASGMRSRGIITHSSANAQTKTIRGSVATAASGLLPYKNSSGSGDMKMPLASLRKVTSAWVRIIRFATSPEIRSSSPSV